MYGFQIKEDVIVYFYEFEFLKLRVFRSRIHLVTYSVHQTEQIICQLMNMYMLGILFSPLVLSTKFLFKGILFFSWLLPPNAYSKIRTRFVLYDWLLFSLPAWEKFAHVEASPCRWYRLMLGTWGLWAGRDLYRAAPAVTRKLDFCRKALMGQRDHC